MIDSFKKQQKQKNQQDTQLTLRSQIKLLKVKSVVVRCARCHCWWWRCPEFMLDFGKGGDYCPACGCTSCSVQSGRDYAAKSQIWQTIEQSFYENLEMLLYGDYIPYYEIDELQSQIITDIPIRALISRNLRPYRVIHHKLCFRHHHR